MAPGGVKTKVLIVGGVAGGASCAARARRISEAAEIILFDKGGFVSFANCGLPYRVSDVIADDKSLILASPELFKNRFNIEVRIHSEVLSVDAARKFVRVRNLVTGNEYDESYDALVLAPGAAPLRPPIPGLDSPGVFALRTIPDSQYIRSWIAEHNVKTAIVVGGGFIGLEMTENFVHMGIKVVLIEGLKQVMAPLDAEMLPRVHERIQERGVELCLGDIVSRIEQQPDKGLVVETKGGKRFDAQIVILGIGVRPVTELAKSAGMELGARGGIRIDNHCRTSDPNIWAVGDVCETKDIITGEFAVLPLAGPANRQGRIAADNIMGRSSSFRGVQATAICGLFDMTVACTGANEKTLQRLNMRYDKVHLSPGHHVGYLPGAKPMDLKVLYDPHDGKLLGAQCVGEEGVDKRIDIISTAIQKGGTVFDLEEAELCYAPQFGAAKDPCNMAGMIAANSIRGDAPLAHWNLDSYMNSFLLDVREPAEFERGHVEGAINISLTRLREAMESEIPAGQPILVYCAVGQRGYYATRALRLSGFNARNFSGGFRAYTNYKKAGLLAPAQ